MARHPNREIASASVPPTGQAGMSRPKALLFDWDNTLVDTWVAIHHALSVTLEAMGQRPWSLDEVRLRVRRSARETFPELFGARSEEATKIFYDCFERDHLETLRARSGAAELLQELTAAGDLYLGVVSNKQGRLLRKEARRLGWDRLFRCLIGATDATRDKPAPEAVNLALESSGLVAGPEVWFIGDTDIDLLCAHNSGCVPILVREEAPGPGEFGDAPPALHFADCGALAAGLRAL